MLWTVVLCSLMVLFFLMLPAWSWNSVITRTSTQSRSTWGFFGLFMPWRSNKPCTAAHALWVSYSIRDPWHASLIANNRSYQMKILDVSFRHSQRHNIRTSTGLFHWFRSDVLLLSSTRHYSQWVLRWELGSPPSRQLIMFMICSRHGGSLFPLRSDQAIQLIFLFLHHRAPVWPRFIYTSATIILSSLWIVYPSISIVMAGPRHNWVSRGWCTLHEPPSNWPSTLRHSLTFHCCKSYTFSLHVGTG